MRLLAQPATPLGEDAARGLAPLPAGEAEQRLLGLPPRLAADWPQLFLAAFERALGRYRSFGLYLDSCTDCGQCAQACPFFRGTGDPRNLPAARLDLARQVYRRHFSLSGRLLPKGSPSERTLMDWFIYFHQCSQCRRCALFCPQGIDVSFITQVCREIMAQAGLSQAGAALAAANCLRSGNSLGVGPEQWSARCGVLESWLEESTDLDIKCPVDEYGAEVLLLAPAEDLVHHQQAFGGYAKLFHAAGVSWTTSTYASEAVNPGLFLSYRNLRLINQRIIEAARELKPKLILWGESGSGWWVGRNLSRTLGTSWEMEDYLEAKRPLSILRWAQAMLDRGAFVGALKRQANDHLNVLCHYPCHLARSTGDAGLMWSILAACCNFLEELPLAGGPRFTLCCGGGGGLWGNGLKDLRMAAFSPLAEVLSGACRDQGVNCLATACATCRSTFLEGFSHYELPLQRAGVCQLLGQALYPARPGARGEG